MKKIVIELSFDDIVSDMFGDASHSEWGGCEPSNTFSEAVRNAVIDKASREILKLISEKAIHTASQVAIDAGREYVEGAMKAQLEERLTTGVFEVRGSSVTLDSIITSRINGMDPVSIVNRLVDTKAEAFAKEMKARYDNVFAMKIVQSLNNQKLLSPEVSKMLLGEEHE